MTDVALRMDLADCGSPERLIAAILRHRPDMKPPVDINALAHSVGIESIDELESHGFEGALVTNEAKSRGSILYRRGRHRFRTRFTVGHELGHFLIPSHKGGRHCTSKDLSETRTSDPVRRIEAEANRFSAGMLMPRPMFEKDLAALGDADVGHAVELARHYETSLEATVNRYADLTDDTCAFVFSKDGVVRYVRWANEFPRLSVTKGQKLPAGSASVECRPLTPRVPSNWHERAADVWLLDADRRNAPRTVLEQTMVQQDGHQLTLLFVDRAELDDADEDAELERTWTPRFSR